MVRDFSRVSVAIAGLNVAMDVVRFHLPRVFDGGAGGRPPPSWCPDTIKGTPSPAPSPIYGPVV